MFSLVYSGLSKKMKCRMQCTQNKIIRYMLNAPQRFHVGVNEFKYVGLLPIEYRVEQLKFGHMYSIINSNAPNCLRANTDMVRNQHLYNARIGIGSVYLTHRLNSTVKIYSSNNVLINNK